MQICIMLQVWILQIIKERLYYKVVYAIIILGENATCMHMKISKRSHLQ